MTLNPGIKLGNYEIVALLGAGGMGEVYRAKDLKLKREVAIKIAPDDFARDGGRVVRFRREAETLASLNHPAIAAIYGLEEDGEARFLVLELVEGETLADRIARGPMPVGEVVPIARQIAEALAAAHEKGVVHRDLKPANIKLTPKANGGVPVPVTSLKAPGELSHDWPQFLPDGKNFLYFSSAPAGTDSAIYAATLGSTDTKLVLKGVNSLAVYAAPGHLVFIQRGTLMAQPFDVEKLELTGSPTPLAENVLPPFSASENEIITYRNRVQAPDRLLWVGWDGREIGPVLPPGYYADPALSPDGLKLAFAKRDFAGATLDIWILELANGALNKFTTDPADDRTPVWSPDGKSIVFWSQRPNAPGLYRKEASGIGAEEILLQTKDFVWPYQWTTAGLLYFGGPSLPTFDIYLYSFADRKSTPLIRTMSIDADGAMSPDGKWLAYEDNHTGRYEVYVTTFPPSETRLSVTNESGVDALWSSDGRKLFYVNSGTLELLSVDVKLGNPPEFGSHHRVHPGPLDWSSGHSFDIDVKRQRVLVQVPTAPQTDIAVLLNWRSVRKK